jgi:hypothetical protein
MLITPHVFLDTTVFDQNSHNYTSTTFKKLAELVKENKIKIYLTTITTREVEAHIKEEIEGAQADINAIFKKRRFLKNATHPSVSMVSEGMKVDEVIYGLGEQFRNWMSEVSVELIPIEGVSIEDVFDKYFDRQPPFGEKKKTEFPDAFTIAALERWCKEKSARMYLISGDSDMASACEENLYLKATKSVSEFLDLLNKGERLAELANSLFEKRINSIIYHLRKTIHMYFFWNHKPNEHFVQAYVESITFPERYLIEVEERRAIFDVLIRATWRADVVIENALSRVGTVGRPEVVIHDQFLKAEVAFNFEGDDAAKIEIEYANIKEEYVPFNQQYSEYPDIYS